MSTPTSRPSLRRPALVGFTVGFGMAFLATMLALLLPVFELLHPWLVPAAALLAPLSDRMADWNGLLNMTLAGVVNGAAYAALAVAITLGLSAVRRDRRPVSG